jgi:alkylation response protein AidB-like acyl-CoA dehydrogenase
MPMSQSSAEHLHLVHSSDHPAEKTVLNIRQLTSEAEAIAAAHEAAAEIRKLAQDASLNDKVPQRQADILSEYGLTAIYVPKHFGGLGASIATVVEVVRIISAADGGVGQILQIHNVMIQGVFNRTDDDFRRRLIADILAGKRFGNALAEGKGKGKGGLTRVERNAQGKLILNGRKVFATGCLLAEWISISATSDDGPVGVLLNRNTPGLFLEDDWEAFGQQHSVSGSIRFENIEIDERFAPRANATGGLPGRTGLTWPQILHAAIDTGIARGALDAAIHYLRNNARVWVDADVEKATHEHHIIKRIGEYAVAVRSAESVLKCAAKLFDEHKQDPENEALQNELILAVATARAQSDHASLFVGRDLFSLTGANSTLAKWNLHRYWADARVHTTHDPIRWRIYHVGNYYLNGVPPDEYGRAARLRLRREELAAATGATNQAV